MERLLLAITIRMLQMQPGACWFLLALKTAHKTDAVHRLWTSYPGEFKHSWHHVFEANELLRAQSLLKSHFRRTRNNERNIRGPFIRFTFTEESIVTEHLTVIG